MVSTFSDQGSVDNANNWSGKCSHRPVAIKPIWSRYMHLEPVGVNFILDAVMLDMQNGPFKALYCGQLVTKSRGLAQYSCGHWGMVLVNTEDRDSIH